MEQICVVAMAAQLPGIGGGTPVALFVLDQMSQATTE